MKRTPSIVALVLVVIASVAPAAQDETGSRTHASTIWTASSLEAARLARVEAQVAAGIKGDDPIELTVRQWMETFNIPGLSVAVFDRHELVWAKTYGVTQPGGSEPVTLDSTRSSRLDRSASRSPRWRRCTSSRLVTGRSIATSTTH